MYMSRWRVGGQRHSGVELSDTVTVEVLIAAEGEDQLAMPWVRERKVVPKPPWVITARCATMAATGIPATPSTAGSLASAADTAALTA